ncbi:MAG: HD domain-containing protein [Lachnoclostridium sp.]|jgi:HD-GYP domain-containing protein (c-di-GMP phosphodiesterase class II)|nr:HD domain-containing protein [Lachnoclostridium sp.]
MNVIYNTDVNGIIRNTLSIANPRIAYHGEVVGYIIYKMLKYECLCSEKDIMDFTMIGFLHDFGLYKIENLRNVAEYETNNLWEHSIYGYLFLKYLSPLENKAEIILYHHLDFKLYKSVKSRYMKIVEFLALADNLDKFLRTGKKEFWKEYFMKYRDIKFSARAIDLFTEAQAEQNIIGKLADGSYKEELSDFGKSKAFTEYYKKKFLQMLAYTIDFRSEHTVIHTFSTVAFAEKIAGLLHMSEREITCVYYGALLHDLGKHGIPIWILEAPRKLSDTEMKIMKAHVQITAKILKGTVIDEVYEIAVRHHEKLDGSGYYRGLKEKDFTLAQKIVMVADIISALHGKRSYKDKMDYEEIKRILLEETAANHLCSKVVDCALDNFNTIIKSFEKEKEEIVGMYIQIKEQYGLIYEKFKAFE